MNNWFKFQWAEHKGGFFAMDDGMHGYMSAHKHIYIYMYVYVQTYMKICMYIIVTWCLVVPERQAIGRHNSD